MDAPLDPEPIHAAGLEIEERDHTAPELWALFVKALAFYPETNARVEACLDRLSASLDAREGDGPVRIVFGRGLCAIGDEQFPVAEGTNLYWLRERLDKAALAGVALHRPLNRGSLIDLSKRLLLLFMRPRRDVGFEELWPEEIDGLEPLARRFGGVFDERATDETLAPIDASDPATAAEPPPQGFLEDERLLLNMLSSREDVTGCLARIQDAVSSLPSDNANSDDEMRGVTRSMDLVGHIVSLLSSEDMLDFERIVDLTTGTLDAIAGRLTLSTSESAAKPDSSDDLRRLMTTVGTKLFGRSSPTFLLGDSRPTPPVEAKSERRRSDSGIAEDLPSFYQELYSLPALPPGFLPPEQLTSPAEEFGTFLHYFIHLEDPSAVEGFDQALRERLDNLDPESAVVLQQYVAAAFDPDSPDRVAAQRVATHLRQHHLTRAMRICGMISVESACASFPGHFVEYLEGLDYDSPEDMAELEAVCDVLGHDKITGAAETLCQNEGILKRGLAKRILAHSHPALMPLAWVMLWGASAQLRGEVLRYMRRLKLAAVEAGPIAAIDRDEYLPDEYLMALLSAPNGGFYSSTLHSQAAGLLARFIEDTSGDERPARLRAIQRLGEMSSPDARCTLENILNASSLPFVRSEPKRVRKLAKDALRAMDRA